MGCTLMLIGEDFDIDKFIAKTNLTTFAKKYKGEPRIPSKPNGYIMPNSSLCVAVSDADFHEFNKQVTETIDFLKINMQEFELIKKTEGIDFATLSFGIDSLLGSEDNFVQSSYFPPELLILCGNLALSVELSIYKK